MSHTQPNRTNANDELLTIDDVAEMLRVPVGTLRYWRHLGAGPQSFKVGRWVRYRRRDVRAWINAKRRGLPRAEEQTSRAEGGEPMSEPASYRPLLTIDEAAAYRTLGGRRRASAEGSMHPDRQARPVPH